MRAGWPEPACDTDDFHLDIDRFRRIGLQPEPDLAGSGQLDIDLGQQRRIEQCPMPGAMAPVDSVTTAQRVERMLGPRVPPPGERQRIDHTAGLYRPNPGDAEFRIDESEIEDRIMG